MARFGDRAVVSGAEVSYWGSNIFSFQCISIVFFASCSGSTYSKM